MSCYGNKSNILCKILKNNYTPLAPDVPPTP